MAWHWLSFADGALPEGSQFLGVAIVEAPDFLSAVVRAHSLSINPGGEVLGFELPPGIVPLEDWRERLLTRAEAEAFDLAHTVKPT